MNRPLPAVFSALFDAPLWKAILAAIAAAIPVWLVQETFGYMEVNELTGIGWAAIALYFVARSCRFLVRRFRNAAATTRLRVILAALAVVHALGLASFFTIPFAFDKPRNLYAEAFEVEFWIFAAVFTSLWALTSLLILLRHARLHQPGEMRALRLLSIGVCAVLLAIAIGAPPLALTALPLFSSYGADLPAPTLLFVHDSWLFFLLPAGAAIVAICIFLLRDSAGKAARFASGGLVGLLVLGNAALYFGLVSLFLPFFGCSFERLDSGYTRLHAAALLGRPDAVLRHLAAGTDVNIEDAQGYRPLDQFGDDSSEIARFLVARGGVRSSKESRQNRMEDRKAQASRETTFSSCRV